MGFVKTEVPMTVSVIADLIFRNWGLIIADRGPAALGLQWTPISQNFGPHLPIRPRQGHRIVPMRYKYILK